MKRKRGYTLMACLWLIAASLALVTQSAHAVENRHDATILPADPNEYHVLVSKGVSYFIETEPITHLQAAALPADRWTLWPDEELINLNTQKNAVWLRFDVRNTAADDAWLLEIFWPFLEAIQLYQYNPHSGQWAVPMTSGLSTPIAKRPLPHRLFTFPLNLSRNRTCQIYLRCASDTKLLVPITFYKTSTYELVDAAYNLIFGMYFGILGVMFLYNLSISLFTEDKSYLYYSIYVLALIIYGLMSTGFGPYYFWDDVAWLKTDGYIVMSNAALLAATLFVRRFLSLKQHGGWVCHCNTFFVVYWIVSTLIYVVKPDPAWVELEDLMAITASTVGLATGIYLWAKGHVSARYFTIAWFFPIVGTMVMLLGLSGVVELSLPLMFSQMVGLVLEVVLLSFALAERINREKASREKAQKTALALSDSTSSEHQEKLAAQNRLLQLQQRNNEDLERQIKERTQKLEQAKQRLEQTFVELSDVSITDPLTGVHNRHYFDRFVDAEMDRAVRIGQPLSVLMVDIDHFKVINDTYGHPVGDQCLKQVALTIRKNVIRSSDLVARYGGEEFVLVLCAITPADAVTVAERIRSSVQKIEYMVSTEAIKMSVSIGVAGWVPLKRVPARQLIKVADDALYDAKLNGRNRVEAAVLAGEVIEKSVCCDE